MRFRRTTTFALAAALATVPAAAAHAAPRPTLKVRSCQTGPTAKQRQATFYARMRAVSGTSRMMMRFRLVDRSSGARSIVPSPQLARWHRSRPGVKTFGWAQTVTGLQTGGEYAAIVDYRWVGSNGKAIRTAHRRSSDCRQDGALPNLTVTRIAARPGDALGTEAYSIDVTNNGLVAARGVDVDLFVDDAGADSATLDSIAAGETLTVRVNGPVCTRRVRAVVDRKDTIHETTEDDNVLRTRCPSVGG